MPESYPITLGLLCGRQWKLGCVRGANAVEAIHFFLGEKWRWLGSRSNKMERCRRI